MKNQKEIFVTKASMPPFQEYIEEIRPIWESRWLTNMGEKHNLLEKSLSKYLGVSHISLTVNGHMALELAIQALNLSGEVITTPFTFASTTHAIARNGLTPVFCDIREDDYTIDATKIEALITSKTSAILPVHVYGAICDVASIDKIAKKHGLKVIYDAAHTFGETLRGQGAASFGDASILSFHATKVYNTIEGGAVCFSDPSLERKLYFLKNFGIQGPEKVEDIGSNAKMNEFQAAMGLCNLRHVETEIAKRKQIAKVYQENLSDISGLSLWKKQADVEANYAYFPIRIEKEKFGCGRDEVFDYLAKYGVHARKYFYPLTSDFKCYGENSKNTPIALKISKEILCLPLYADLDIGDAENIAKRVRELKK